VPKILPQGSVVWFLDKAHEIPLEVVEESWELLKDYLWECKKVPLNKDDYKAFKTYGWEKGISEYRAMGLRKEYDSRIYI
jgi:hypothetical protein